MAANETYPTYPAPLAANGPNRQLGAASCDTDDERKANGMSGSRWCQVAANETTEPTSPAPLAAHGPNRQLAVEILGPRRPAFDIPRVIVTVLVAQHGGHIVDDSTKAAWEASRNECSL